jgi:hypothetical protein
MIKIKFETKQDYIDYCFNNDIVSYRRYGHTNIDNSHICKIISPKDGNAYIEEEPLSYPCIFVYTLDNEENADGTFIYPNDF